MKTIFEEGIQERRALLLKSWPAFAGQPPLLVGEVIDRDKTEMPNDFCQWAPGLVIASDYLLRAAGYCPGRRGPSGWKEGQPDVFTKVIYRNRLMVRGCGELWSVERENDEVLAFRFGPTPIFTHTRQAAMRLAEYCHPKPDKGEGPFPEPRGVASTLRWAASDPSGIHFCN